MIMASTNNITKVTRQVQLTKIIAGITQFFMSVPTMTMGGKAYAPAAVVALLQAALAAVTQSSNSKAAWLADVQTERNQLTALGPVLRYIKTYVTTYFGDTQDAAQKLDVFGYSPRKPRSVTVAMKAEAAELGKATRIARGTKGPKQKAKIKGTIVVPPPSGGEATTVTATAGSTTPAQTKP
jgi:hypothetical protein